MKLIDFGSSCYTYKRMFTYIQSRFYRAPEVLLGLSYSTSIDMWSFGCLLYELYTGHPLFPSKTEQDLFARIVEVLGTPPPDLVARGKFSPKFYEQNELRPSAKRGGLPGSRPLRYLLSKAEPQLLELVSECLLWDASLRLSPEAALEHPFFKSS